MPDNYVEETLECNHTLGEPKGTVALTRFLSSKNTEVRRTAVRAYAQLKDISDKRLLSRDLDATDPWRDPQEQVTDAQVGNASSQLNITPEQVRSRYEVMAADLNLKLSWKNSEVPRLARKGKEAKAAVAPIRKPSGATRLAWPT